MAAGSFQFTAGSGTYQHTYSYTRGAVTGHAPYVLPAEYQEATYNVNAAAAISMATANSHLLQIMAGSALNVRIRHITIEQAANATSAVAAAISVFRLTTAGTGGTAVTPAKMDNGDAASGATAMTLPSSKGAEGVEWRRGVLLMRQAIGTTSSQPDDTWEWTQQPNGKPLIIPAGTANGIAIENISAVAAATVIINVEFIETNY